MPNRDALHELHELLPNCLRHDRLRLEASLATELKRAERPEWIPEHAVSRLLHETRKAIALRHRRHERLPQISYPPNLPITARKDEIVAAIRANQVVVIAGETGSGKTTQLPKMCLEAGLGVEGKIGCTQPRRVAALSISRRIAQELNVQWGEEVGCKIRFTDRSSPVTYIKLMTDGILLAETQGDRDLTEYDAIIIDEAHERSLNIDFLLGHLKLLLQRRPDLKLVITSATIDTEAFSKAFGNAPVLQVSGRTFPVEIRYAPYDHDAEEAGDLTYIDAAVNAVEAALLESDRGDVLVFMPSERDIRETQDDLVGRFSSEAEVVPLFGRLSSGEQDRVFAPSQRRKIIVATNIAETSLTIPGVRYVVDTGLARISRYSPRTRTKRLPIEPVSQSSAKQRAGRSGRVENGVCIRLYAEEDFLARPAETQPEIQRANLAEVILRMKAWRLGEMETFPFLNPPQPQAIQSGYQLLQELGALDDNRNLTSLGRDLARLPVDPSIGRMILQSFHEGALDEILIVAAGLSIQDARERPMDKQEAADQAHRQFLDPHSDFLSLLNIWNAYDARLESLKTQNQMRRFCHANFLSYIRMREWIDVHAQLEEAVSATRSSRTASSERRLQPASGFDVQKQAEACAPKNATRREHASQPWLNERYAAIHRSILAGLLGHIAQRGERNMYKASGNRQVMVWPGSSLFLRDTNGQGPKARPNQAGSSGRPEPPRQAEWIVAGELVETSRLFARTVAGLTPDWIVELGAHLTRHSYGEPYWDPKAGRVLARERITLFGLEVQERPVDYGRVDPGRATDLFIRAVLIDEDVELPHRFVQHNHALRQKIEVWRTRLRERRIASVDESLFAFYAARLENVSSIHDLNRIVREKTASDPNFLFAGETDLTGGVAVDWDTTAFPKEVTLADQRVPLVYAYAPGEEHDGITLKVPVSLAVRLDPAILDCVVPGLRLEQVEFLLKSLSKAYRVPLMPLAPKAAELVATLEPEAGLEGLRRLIKQKYGVAIPPDAWKRELLPDHLRPRIAVTGEKQRIVTAGRDLQSLKQGLEQHATPAEQRAWTAAVERWERYDLRTWSFGDLPEQIDLSAAAGLPLVAFPGLESDGATAHLKLFRKREDSLTATRPGFERLVELALHKELAWVQRDLRTLEKASAGYAGLGSAEDLVNSAFAHARNYIVKAPEPVLPLTHARFDEALQDARERIPGFVPRLLELLTAVLQLRAQILAHRGYPRAKAAPPGGVVRDLKTLGGGAVPATGKALAFLPGELGWYLPKNFLQTVPFERLSQWPRYLKAILIRADRALVNPVKDAEKARMLQPYVDALLKLAADKDLSAEARRALVEYRWMLEEFKVSTYAQELGTAQPVSAKKLDTQLALVRAR